MKSYKARDKVNRPINASSIYSEQCSADELRQIVGEISQIAATIVHKLHHLDCLYPIICADI